MRAGDLRVRRIHQTPRATYGRLYDWTQAPIGVTLELPWRNNQPDISCILTGTFPWTKTESPHLEYVTPELTQVPKRSEIRMHIACLPRDLLGCVGVGTAFGNVDYEDGTASGKGYGITGSGAAFHRLMNLLEGIESGTLTIDEAYDACDWAFPAAA